MHPVLMQIGPIVIRWYGVMIAIACLLGIWVAGREAERKDSSDGIIVIDFLTERCELGDKAL